MKYKCETFLALNKIHGTFDITVELYARNIETKNKE